MEPMYRSLSQVLLKVPDSTRLFPGHDYASVPVAAMSEVRQHNPELEDGGLPFCDNMHIWTRALARLALCETVPTTRPAPSPVGHVLSTAYALADLALLRSPERMGPSVGVSPGVTS
jgi:glyoxylase-like metal-dependent hydrolase (beta-lactamase superfamily II)